MKVSSDTPPESKLCRLFGRGPSPVEDGPCLGGHYAAAPQKSTRRERGYRERSTDVLSVSKPASN